MKSWRKLNKDIEKVYKICYSNNCTEDIYFFVYKNIITFLLMLKSVLILI